MCGITGIAYYRGAASPSAELIRAMCRTLVHRGPDDEGIHIADGVGLGIRRLAIIDPEGGHQPMLDEGRRIAVVLNGEIYNFRELRRSLERKGYRFTTRSDTEVIVHAYDEYGVEFVDHLNGMFAIALHDIARRKLVLVRDHLGVKPLYFASGEDFIVWGSEVKAVLASGLVDRELDLDSLGQFVAWEYVPGSRTLHRSISKLEPSEMLEADLDSGRWRKRSYWDIPGEPVGRDRSAADWEDEVDATLATCVRRQLVADVPLGAFLSGGVDSSLVVAAMDAPRSFSVSFADDSYDELPYARAVARHLESEHVHERIQPETVELFDDLMHMLDDPIADFSVFPTFQVSRMARKHVTVALSGDGGDELFGGYETYVADRMARAYSRLPAWFRHHLVEPPLRALRPREVKKGLINKAKRFVEGHDHDPALAHARWRLFVGEAVRASLFTPEARAVMSTPVPAHILGLFERAGDRDAVNRCLYVDTRSYLCDNILTKVDRMSMAVSLEARVPFLDKELVALAFQVPGSLKVDGKDTKLLLKRVAARHVPRHCVYRPKEGFSIPMKTWLGDRFRPLMEELLSRAPVEQEGVFFWPTVARLKHEHLSGIANHSHVLWSMIVFQAWRRRWLDGPSAGVAAGAPRTASR